MSAPPKRAADTAFEEIDNAQTSNAKRRRRRESRNASKVADVTSPDTQKGHLSTLKGPTKQAQHPPSKAISPPQEERIERPQPSQSPYNALAKLKKKNGTAEKSSSALVEKEQDDGDHTSRKRKKSKGTKQARSGWSLADTKGGIFVNQDPVLTPDTHHLILPTHSDVQVYAARTSLLVRSLQLDAPSDIVSCTLSTRDPSRLYVATANGSISIWNWETGKRLRRFESGKRTQQLIVLHSGDDSEMLLAVQRDSDGIEVLETYIVSPAHLIERGTHILKRLGLSPTVQPYGNGKVLVAVVENKLLIAYSSTPGGENASYTWRELTITGTITSFDVHSSASTKSSRSVPVVDIAIGLESGIILVYEDTLYKLIGKEKNIPGDDLAGRKLHWHRFAVSAVRWSRDKNYIISGGDETVLVIWQLDTNQKQFLPHLSTPILNITVSASGAAYALLLADNSVMVLSTADLTPSASMSGLALPQPASNRTTVVLHPQSPNTLLAAVPSDTRSTNRPSTILQTFDLPSSRQLARQALTRNLITTISSAPSGQSIVEPNVLYLSLSPDGKWLATIDQWVRNTKDTEEMYIESDPPALRSARVETCLRFWASDEDSQTWQLVTRVDEPHAPGFSSVLAISANPSKSEFATIGADGKIHTWIPRARHRSGVPVRSASGDILYTWSRQITITSPEEVGNADPQTAAVAYSSDGSTLAVSWSYPDGRRPRLTHLISAASGEIVLSQPDFVSNGSAQLAFLGRHLVGLSRTFAVFDTLTASTICSITLDAELRGTRQLAVNTTDHTVAIAASKHAGPNETRVVVLSITGSEVKPAHETRISGVLKALLASPLSAGYVLIDEKNRISSIRPNGVASLPSSAVLTTKENEIVSKSLDSIFGLSASAVSEAAPTLAISEREAPPATKLEEVLRIVSSREAPGPQELLRRVLGVVGRKIEEGNVANTALIAA